MTYVTYVFYIMFISLNNLSFPFPIWKNKVVYFSFFEIFMGFLVLSFIAWFSFKIYGNINFKDLVSNDKNKNSKNDKKDKKNMKN